MITQTRSQALGALIHDALLHGRLTWREFAIAVVDHYTSAVPLLDRAVKFQAATTADDFEAVVRNNTQTVRRYVCGERQLPADLEESLIAALPAADRERVLTVLLARSGLLYARKPAPDDGRGGHVRCATDLMRRAADAVDSVAPMLADQRITPADAPHFAVALRAIGGVMSACVSLTTQISDAARQPRPNAAPSAPAVH
jgi:hypothetical protein